MIILLQSVAILFSGFFDIFHITKCGKVILLQDVTDCYYKVRLVFQSVADFIANVRRNTGVVL